MTNDEIRLFVRAQLNADLVRLPDTLLTQMINAERRDIAAKLDIPHYEKTQALSTVNGTQVYSLAADFLRPIAIWFNVVPPGISTPFIGYLDRDEFVTSYPTAAFTSSVPASATIFGNLGSGTYAPQLYLGPTPNAIYALNIDYYQVPASFSGASDTDGLATYEPNLLLWNLCALCAEFLDMGDRIPIFAERARAAERLLAINAARRRNALRRLETVEVGSN